MRALAEECIEWLKKQDYYDTFICIAEASSTKFGDINYLDIQEMSVEEAIQIIKKTDLSSGEEKIQMKIHSLIYYGFIQVVGFEYKNISNINYQFNSGIMDANYNTDLSKYESEHPFDKKTKIKLTKNADISGRFLYEEILDDKAEKEMNEQFKNVLDPIENSYKNYVDESRKELEKKIKGIEDGTIKSIEIISIFSAVIALLISNIMGITNLAAITLRTILIMNMSIVLSILFLLIFVRLLIKEKDNKKSFLMSLIIMGIFVLVSVVLVA